MQYQCIFSTFVLSCLLRKAKVRHPTRSHVHRYYTPRKYHMAYLFMPFPMTLDDLEGHSPNAGLIKCNSMNICATFSTVLTDTPRREVPRRWLSFLFPSRDPILQNFNMCNGGTRLRSICLGPKMYKWVTCLWPRPFQGWLTCRL